MSSSVINRRRQGLCEHHNISPHKWNRLSARAQPLLIETPAVYKFTASFPQLDHKTSKFLNWGENLGFPFTVFILAEPGEPQNVRILKHQHRSTMKLGCISYAEYGLTILKQSTTDLCFWTEVYNSPNKQWKKALGMTSLCQITHYSETEA